MSLLRRPGAVPGPDGRHLSIGPDGRDWKYIAFDVHQLPTGTTLRGDCGDRETALIVLGGHATVHAADEHFTIRGRADVWDRVPPSVLLLSPATPYTVRADSDLRLLVTGAEARERRPPRLIRPDQIAVEHRGTGQTARTVQHLLPPSAPAERLILVEVYTPAGNWSSFPPHKHDVDDPPRESELEEIYYFRVDPPRGFALQRIYTPDRALDQTLAVTDGDLVLVPRGYHVVAASPGHACYYLNVMAGRGRAWNFTLDPDYAALLDWQKPAVAATESS